MQLLLPSGKSHSKSSFFFLKEIHFRTPANAAIGNYKLRVTANGKTVEDHFVLLLNPWFKEDTVYFPDAAGIDEYVLNGLFILELSLSNIFLFFSQ